MPTLTHVVRNAIATIHRSALVTRLSRERVAETHKLVRANIYELTASCFAIGLERGGVVYALGRRPPMSGGAESELDTDVARRRLGVVRLKLKRGQLPRLAARRIWYGEADGLPCLGCD